MTARHANAPAGHGAPSLPLLGTAGFASVSCTRLCDAMLPALALAFATTTAEAAATIYGYAIAYSVMLLVCGPLGDRFGKGRLITLAVAACALTTASAALAPTLPALVAIRVAMGAGTAAIVPLTVAWIGDTVPLSQRQQTLARYSGFTVMGMVVGPLLGGMLTQLVGWRAAFGLLALLFGFMAVQLLLSARRGAGLPAPAPASAPYLRQVGLLLRLRWTRLVLLGAFTECALGLGCMAFLPTVLHDRFGLSALHAGAVAALFGVGGFLFSRTAERLMLRLSRPTLPAIGGTAMALAMALLAAMPHWGWAVAACPLAGYGFFAIHNTLQTRATQLSASATGLAVSLFSSFIFVGQSVGVSIGAWTFTHLAPSWSFGAAALGLLALGLGVRRALLPPATASAPRASEG